jgi:hypothetical protein
MALGEVPHDAKHGRKAMKKVALALAAAALTLSAGSALAQKKQLVIVVKGLDNPFFEAIHQGCEKWNKENASSPQLPTPHLMGSAMSALLKPGC